MKLTTTLNLIRACSPCGLKPQSDGTLTGYLKLSAHLCSEFGQDEKINLLTILDSNGVQDMLWCLRATQQDRIKLQESLADLIFYGAIGGAFLMLGCVIVAFLIVGGVAYKIQNGWTMREALRRELKDWP